MLKSAKHVAHVLPLSRVASLALLALFGCSSAVEAKKTPTPAPAPSNSNDYYDPGPSSTTSGPTTPTLDLPGAPTQLARGGAKLIGITTDEQLVYVANGGTSVPQLMTVPLAGGNPTVLIPSYDENTSTAMVSGGAVGIWTNISNHQGTFAVWTRATGLKSNLTNSHDSAEGVFAATSDGTKIAFSVATNSSLSTDLAIATTSTVGLTTNGVFADSLMDTAASRGIDPSCAPDMRFMGRNLIMAFCSGTSSIASFARLYWVGDNTVAPVRLDNVGAVTGNIKPFWFSDPNGTKIYAVSSDGSGQARIVTPPVNGQAVTSVALDTDAASAGFITADGQTVVYRTPELGLRRASTGPNPAPMTLVPGVRTIIDIAPDLSKVLVRTLDMNDGLRDIRAADITTPNQVPHDIVPTASADPVGYTADSQFVLYLDNINGSTNHLQSQAAMGGALHDLAQNVTDVWTPSTGSGAVALTRDGSGTYSIIYVNASSGHASPVLASQVPSAANGGLASLNHKLVWATQSSTNPGVFVAPIP